MIRLLTIFSLLVIPGMLSAQSMDEILKNAQQELDKLKGETTDQQTQDALYNLLNNIFSTDEGDQTDESSSGSWDSDESSEQVPGMMNMGMDTGAFAESMRQMAASFGQAGEAPDSYSFDLVLDVEITADGEKPVNMSMLYRKDGKQLGIRTMDKKDKNTIVMDNERNFNCIFIEDSKGKKTGMVMPNFASAFGSMGAGKVQAAQADSEVKFTKTGNVKTVAGYRCEEYLAESDDMKASIYISKDLDLNWNQAMGESFKQFLGDQTMTEFGKLQGAMLESHSTDKKSGEVTNWVTTAVHKQGETIIKSDYQFMGK